MYKEKITAPNTAKPRITNNTLLLNLLTKSRRKARFIKGFFRITSNFCQKRTHLRLRYNRITRAIKANASGSMAKGPKPMALKPKSICINGFDEIV